ncbi:unnamed protein product [Prorocentrum cordatum]|uniref:Uncharacterized protein n=1 Tax=Prorocentrum cordatum TaxID=2364126 RepID=A0ABN9SPD3_9DINO|nr:unnamed protein product [Polarella glacialis]
MPPGTPLFQRVAEQMNQLINESIALILYAGARTTPWTSPPPRTQTHSAAREKRSMARGAVAETENEGKEQKRRGEKSKAHERER